MLLPHIEFDMGACIGYARQVNPGLEIMTLSAKTGEGLQAWYDWISGPRIGHARERVSRKWK